MDHRMPPPFEGHDGHHHGPHRREDGKERVERTLAEISVTNWLTDENASFTYRDGFLYMTFAGKEHRVTLARAFPFNELWKYISVLDSDGNEVGLIRDIQSFEGNTQKLLKEELERRYYAPVILAVLSTKERYGFAYWKVKTKEGVVNITMKDVFRSIIRVSENHILLLDVDGNRYEIPDIALLDKKSYRKIELYF